MDGEPEQEGAGVSAALQHRLPSAVVIALLAALAFGCVAPDGYYGGTAGYGLGYYQPYGVEYGGWGPTYFVAPFRDHGHEREPEHRAEHGGHEAPHAFHAAPAGRAMPSLPSTPRGGGGGHGGGAPGGGQPGGGGHGH